MKRWTVLAFLGILFVCARLPGAPRAALPASAQAPQSATGAPQATLIVVSIDEKSLSLYENGALAARYAVATGTRDTPTPIGAFTITSRFMPSEPGGFGTRFLGLNVAWGQYGIHGTNKPGSIGRNASHGCIRMRVRDAEALYARTPTGTRVIVEGGPYGEYGHALSALSPGDRGSAVRAVQRRLKQLGYYEGTLDGIYGAGMENAVRKTRTAMNLPESGHVNAAFYAACGIILFE